MKFLSIYKTAETGVPPTQQEMETMGKLIEEGMKAGYLLAVEGCLPSANGARIRLSTGEITITDGPFTESKEVIVSFALIEVRSKDEALELARRFWKVVGDGEGDIRQVFGPGDE